MSSRARLLNSVVTLYFGALLAILVYSAWEEGSLGKWQFAAFGWQALTDYAGTMFLTIGFAVFCIGIFALERLRPADSSQPALSRGLLLDVVIAIPNLVVTFIVIVPAVVLYVGFLQRHVPQVQWLDGVPLAVRIVVAFVLVDFGNWLSHLVRHKVPFLWEFHALHHSQAQMNLMTEFRAHPLDSVFASAIRCVLFFTLLLPGPTAAVILILEKYYLMFLHANIDISYGPLDRILVSPHVHRVHHSSAKEHHDHNYGVYFSLWDTLFGTLYRGNLRPGRTGL